MTNGIEKMMKLTNENQEFKSQLQACKTSEEAVALLKQEDIDVMPQELIKHIKELVKERTEVHTTKTPAQLVDGCLVHW